MLLQIEDLRAGYHSLPVLDGVSLHIDRGESVTLLGRNGMGKTTIFRAITGLVDCMGGSIRFDGNDIAKLSIDERANLKIDFVPDDKGIFSNLTVRENLKMAEIRAKDAYAVDYAFNLFPRLKERQKQKAGTLSGGEQQMLTIARALIRRPKLLILDEISQGLATQVVEDLIPAFEEVKKTGAILFAEQSLSFGCRVADRVYVVNNGSIVFDGDVETLNNWEFKNQYLSV